MHDHCIPSWELLQTVLNSDICNKSWILSETFCIEPNVKSPVVSSFPLSFGLIYLFEGNLYVSNQGQPNVMPS